MKYLLIFSFLISTVHLYSQTFVQGHTDIAYGNSLIPGLSIKNPNSGLLNSSFMRIYNDSNNSIEIGVRSSAFGLGANNAYINALLNKSLDLWAGNFPRVRINPDGKMNLFNDNMDSIGIRLNDFINNPVLQISNSGIGDESVSFSDDGQLMVGSNVIDDAHRLKIKHTTGTEKALSIENTSLDSWTVEVDGAADYTWRYGGTTPGAYLDASDGATLKNFSDARLKNNIETLPKVLDKITLLRPTTYNFKNIETNPNSRTLGFIAQEVEKIFPDMVSEKEGYKTLSYSAFSVLAIKAIQEQQQIIKSLEHRISQLEQQ